MVRWLDERSPVRWLGEPGRSGLIGELDGLPSAESAEAVVSGDFKAIPVAAFHTTVRAGLVGLGLYAAGMRGAGQLLKYGFAGALGIEVFVLLWAWYEKNKRSPA